MDDFFKYNGEAVDVSFLGSNVHWRVQMLRCDPQQLCDVQMNERMNEWMNV